MMNVCILPCWMEINVYIFYPVCKVCLLVTHFLNESQSLGCFFFCRSRSLMTRRLWWDFKSFNPVISLSLYYFVFVLFLHTEALLHKKNVHFCIYLHRSTSSLIKPKYSSSWLKHDKMAWYFKEHIFFKSELLYCLTNPENIVTFCSQNWCIKMIRCYW